VTYLAIKTGGRFANDPLRFHSHPDCRTTAGFRQLINYPGYANLRDAHVDDKIQSYNCFPGWGSLGGSSGVKAVKAEAALEVAAGKANETVVGA